MVDEGPEILERGQVFFFYRPKVEEEEPADLDDVQRTFMVLKAGSHTRLLALGRKKLPDPAQHPRPYWGFVEAVTDSPASLRSALAAEDYKTATRGTRHRPAARAVAQGCYAIAKHTAGKGGKTGRAHGRVHTHFAYALQRPAEPAKEGSPQDQMNLKPQASYILQVKNPEATAGPSQPRSAPAKRTEPFPPQLQQKLGALRFAPADPPAFLDHEGCEFLLIAASDDVAEELGGQVLDKIEHECEGVEEASDVLLELLEDSKKDKGSPCGTSFL